MFENIISEIEKIISELFGAIENIFSHTRFENIYNMLVSWSGLNATSIGDWLYFAAVVFVIIFMIILVINFFKAIINLCFRSVA